MTINGETVAKVIPPAMAARLAEPLRDLSWRQAPAYAGRAARDIGARSEFVELDVDREFSGLANVRIKLLPMTRWGIAFVSQGPAVSPSGAFDRERYSAAIDALVDEYVLRRGLVLRVQPPLHRGAHESEIAALFAGKGFAPLRRPPYRTIAIDLAPPIDTLRRNLNGKWRTDLSRAERQGLSVSRSADPEAFARFLPLFEQLAASKKFAPPQDVSFFRDVAAAAAGGADHIRIHIAEHDGEIVAGHIGSYTGDTAVYLLGAANEKGRELRAAYLLQWAVVEYAKGLGQAIYDLGGIDEAANPDVFRFKNRMGGRTIESAAGFERTPGPLAAMAVGNAEVVARLIDRLRPRSRR